MCRKRKKIFYTPSKITILVLLTLIKIFSYTLHLLNNILIYNYVIYKYTFVHFYIMTVNYYMRTFHSSRTKKEKV